MKAVRRRRIAAPVSDVWTVVSDPHHLPRWWPRTVRVENVKGKAKRGSAWTQVLETRDGRSIRADFRCLAATANERLVFEQQLEGTPFDRILRGSTIEIGLAADGDGTEVTLEREQKLRGLSRFGGPMMGRANKKMIDEALDGLEEAFSTGGGR